MDIAISKESVCLSIHQLKHYSFILYFCLRVKVFTLKFIRPYTLQRRYNAIAYNAETVITRLGLGSRFFPHQFESVALFPRNAAV